MLDSLTVESGAGVFQRTWRDTGLLAVAIALGFAIFNLAQVLTHPFLLVLAGTVLACALSPLANATERWVPRVVSVLLVYLVVLLGLAGLGWLVIPALIEQAQMLVENAPMLAEDAQAWIDRRGLQLDGSLTDQFESVLTEGARRIVFLAPSTFSVGFDILFVIAVSVYLTISGPAMLDFTVTLFPLERREHARDTLVEMGATMGGYVRGALLDGLILGTITWVALTLLGVDFPLVLALVAFLGVLVPVIGPLLSAIPAIAIAGLESITLGIVVALLYLGLQQLESYVLLPKIMRRQAGIPPLLTLVALLAGAALAGIVGAILAIPLFGGLWVLFQRVAVPALRRESRAPEAGQMLEE